MWKELKMVKKNVNYQAGDRTRVCGLQFGRISALVKWGAILCLYLCANLKFELFYFIFREKIM